MWTALVAILVLAALFALFIQRSGGFRFPWLQFYVRGKESGFRIRELNLLRKVAVENRLRNPTSLFWSEKTLDRCIRGTIIRFRSEDREEDRDAVHFLNKLFDFRKDVEFRQPKYRLGLRSTRSLEQGQVLKITLPQTKAVYTSTVVENMRRYLAISYPKGPTLPYGFSWQGQRIQVYFWRPEDAGYYFEAKVIGDYLERRFPILHIAHGDKLVRAQKRNSVRATLDGPAILKPLRTIDEGSEVADRSGGYRCRMVDISEDGAAVLVGGKAKPGLPVKVITTVNDQDVVLSGTVKGVSYRQKKNVSVLHIQAKPPSPQMKNIILTYVYGILREGETKLHSSSAERGGGGGNRPGYPTAQEAGR